jgi:oligo-1,6-glucosidase
MLFTFLLSMRATPFIYNGDEIGMTNIRFQRIEEYNDVETRTVYRKIINRGGDGEAFLKDQQMVARDNSRTPFQWSAAPNGGFTNGEPWMRVNENYTFINREAQEKDPWSVIHYLRKLIRLRRQHTALIYGEYELVNPGDSLVYAYTRSLHGSRLFVVLNFSQKEPVFNHPFPGLAGKDILINNYPNIRFSSSSDLASTTSAQGFIRLLPYQSLIFRLPPNHGSISGAFSLGAQVDFGGHKNCLNTKKS